MDDDTTDRLERLEALVEQQQQTIEQQQERIAALERDLEPASGWSFHDQVSRDVQTLIFGGLVVVVGVVLVVTGTVLGGVLPDGLVELLFLGAIGFGFAGIFLVFLGITWAVIRRVLEQTPFQT